MLFVGVLRALGQINGWCVLTTNNDNNNNRTRGWGGNSVKSALCHKLKMDTRDDALAPTTGNYFELNSVIIFDFFSFIPFPLFSR